MKKNVNDSQNQTNNSPSNYTEDNQQNASVVDTEEEARRNAWGKPTTKKSINDAITRIQQLRQEVALDKTSIRSMIEEGRR